MSLVAYRRGERNGVTGISKIPKQQSAREVPRIASLMRFTDTFTSAQYTFNSPTREPNRIRHYELRLRKMGWFGSDKKSEEQSSAQTKQQPPEDVSKPIPRQKLPTDLQKIIDREDDFFDRLYEGKYVHMIYTWNRYLYA